MNLSFNVGDDPQNIIENRKRFFESVGIPDNSLAIPRQVHGDTVRRVTEPGRFESCDALLTNVKEIFLAVSTADCVPIFLVDPITKSLAAVHSGWRGSKLSILSKTVIALQNEFGTKVENLVAYIGPSAAVCCYEVGEEVAKEFDEKYLQKNQGRKAHLDLKQFNKNLLLEAGVHEKNIEVSPHCTICNPELFHSYRRDKEKSGRMMGVIGLACLTYGGL